MKKFKFTLFMNIFFKKYGIIVLLAALIPIVMFSKDNLINMTIRKISGKSENKPIIQSSNQLPEMTFQVFNTDKRDSRKIFSTKNIGTKYILHFFASWCGHCVEEHSGLFLLKNEQIPIYGVAWQDSSENLRSMINKLGNPYTEIFLDPLGSQSSALNIPGIPLTIIVNSKNEVVFGKIGTIEAGALIDEFKKVE